jgi:hypothetical protein
MKQGRFSHLGEEDIEQVQKEVDHTWHRLMKTIESGE